MIVGATRDERHILDSHTELYLDFSDEQGDIEVPGEGME